MSVIILLSVLFTLQYPVSESESGASDKCDCDSLSVGYITSISAVNQEGTELSQAELEDLEEDFYEQMESEDWVDQMREESSFGDWLESMDMDLMYDN